MKKRGRESSLLAVLLWEDQASQRMSQLHKAVLAKESTVELVGLQMFTTVDCCVLLYLGQHQNK
jgi:hypothetical protein